MRFVIIGGGGLGLELYTYILCDIKSGIYPDDTSIGIIDESVECEVMKKNQKTNYLGDLQEYAPSAGDYVLIAIGHVENRKKVYQIVKDRCIPMTRYIHPSAWIASNATIGEGCIITPNCIVSAYAEVLDNVVMNVFSGAGHGAKVGAHCVMGPYSVLNGNTVLGEGCYLGTRATLFPSVVLGKGCIIDAHTAVKDSAGDYKIITDRGQYRVLENRLAEK